MANQNFNINKESVIDIILNRISKQDEYKRPVQFGAGAMAMLLDMKETTDKFFSYTWCQNYVDVLLSLLNDHFCCVADNEVVGFSVTKDGFNLPETVTLNRKEAEETH